MKNLQSKNWTKGRFSIQKRFLWDCQICGGGLYYKYKAMAKKLFFRKDRGK